MDNSPPAESGDEHHVTRIEDRVPLRQKLAIGVGGFANTTGTQIAQVMIMPIFQIVLGLHPLLVGVAMTIPRLWDALSDPIMGALSDNFRSRWGRRRPFILVGAVLMAMTFSAIWMVPKHWSTRFDPAVSETQVETVSEEKAVRETETTAAPETDTKIRGFTWRDWWMFSWLSISSLLFYTSYTIYAVPLVSLSYEVTPDYHERTRVMAFWGFFTMVGNLLINVYYPLTERSELFEDPLQGARFLSLIVGAAIFIGFGILPALFAKERFYRAASQQAKVPLLPAIKETLQSRNMIALLGMTLSLAFVGAMAAALAVYIVMFYVFGGDRESGSALNALNGIGFQIVGFASIPVLSWIATRMGKRRAVFLVLGMAALGGVLKWFIFTPEGFLFPVSLPWLENPIRLHVLLLDPLLSGPIWVALSMIVPSMIADLCDVDEVEHGTRREGIYSAVFSWVQKCGFSLTFIFTGLAVWLSGFDEALGVNQPEGTFLSLRICFAGFSTLAMLLGMVFVCFYNVSEKRAYEVRDLLEKRRGKT